MQKALRIIKNQLKYTTILIALMLFVAQIYFGFIKENEMLKEDESQSKNTLNIAQIPERANVENNNIQISDNICEEDSYELAHRIFQIIFKCGLAFLAGGLFSDMKFIKFGLI